ncbi:MAG TPA: BTAD domain-containing putative transcriptional regulator [Longimicrobium sp.]|nr:BTAD domain-containing putative transcriptional regulator [Longimicrobium sp.]
MFFLKLLGCAALERDGVPVSGRAVHRRRLALLAVLAAARGRMVGRERVIGYLWPDHPGDAARHLLSESLYILRKTLGDDAIVAAGDEISLDPAVVGSDLAAFQAALDADRPEEAVALYGGPFLDGFYVSEAPDFERWAEQERDRLARAYARGLEALAESAEAVGEPLRAAEWWKRLAREDPFSSRVALRVMQALEAGGERAAAVRHASVHAALVREELGAEPDAEIDALARRLREAPRPTPVAPPAPAEPARASASPRSATSAAPAESGGATAVAEAPRASVAPVEVFPAPAPQHEHAGEPARRWTPARLRVAAVLAVVLAAVALVFMVRRPGRAGVDASTYIVLPLAQRSGPGANVLSPDQAELLLHDALSRWTDVRLVDAQRARDLMTRHGPPSTLAQARSIAEEAGAGRLVWGEITPLGDSVAVRAALYDLNGDESLAERTVRIGRDLNGVTQRIGELASALLGRAGAVDGDPGTTSLAAWQAYQAGRLAMGRWDLSRARDELARAVTLDPAYASAHFWLAQAMAWDGYPDPAEWKEDISRAMADSAHLSPRERALGHGLVALSDGRFPDACHHYNAMLARDSTDFAAWYGLGECQTLDNAVVRDPSSPSGWRFRSSYHQAIDAFSRALRTVPSALQAFRGAGFVRLQRLLQTDDRWLRPGFVAQAPGDTAWFAGYVSLQADTVAFIPWKVEDVAALKKETIPATRALAGARNRKVLADVLREWVRAFPQSPDAHEGLARGLEAMGRIREVRQGEPSAFSELARARALATDSAQRLRLGIAQVRLHLHVNDFARARAAADSVLGEWDHPGPRDARYLAPLAVLTGRTAKAVELMRTAAPELNFWTPRGRKVDVPVPIVEARSEAAAYAALGMVPEYQQAEARVERLVGAWFGDPARREFARTALLNWMRRLSTAYGARGGAPIAEPDPEVEMQQMLARGDAAGVRARLAAMTEALGARRPGDRDPSYVFPESALRLALGDTAGAVTELDRMLLALEALPIDVNDKIEETGAVLGMMRLRAQVAAAQGDARTAATWRNALGALWAGADPRLKGMIGR